MKVNVLRIATLLLSVACFSVVSSAESVNEKMIESPKHKSDRIGKDVNTIFQRAFHMAAAELDTRQLVKPFAVILKKDGKLGVFGIDSTERNANLTVDDQTASIRKYLIELVVADQIDASVQTQYVTVQQKNKAPQQGLMFELEHIDGVSLLRFLPISKIKDDHGVDTGKLLFDMKALTTTVKPQTIFAFAKAS